MMTLECSRCRRRGPVEWAPDTLAEQLPHWRSYTVLCARCMGDAAATLNGVCPVPLAPLRSPWQTVVDRLRGRR